MRILNGLILLLMISVSSVSAQSNPKKVADTTGVQELTIKKTGFGKKDEIVIKYRQKDRTVLEVIKNGEILPQYKYAEYEKKLREALELKDVDEILPKIEAIDATLKSQDSPDSVKYTAVSEFLPSMDSLKSSLVATYREVFQLQKHILGMQLLEQRIKQFAQERNLLTGTEKKIVLKIKNGIWTLNNQKLSSDLSAELTRLMQQYDMEPGTDKGNISSLEFH